MEIRKRLFIAAFALLLIFRQEASAHPMGNFSINHYSRLTVERRDIFIDYILDFAEIPTFQLFPEIRQGTFDGASAANGASAALTSPWIDNLTLTAEGVTLPLQLSKSEFELKRGAGGLSTLRAVLHLRSNWAGTGGVLHFEDRNFPERIGWKEIVVSGTAPIGFPDGNPFSQDKSNGLSEYPLDLLEHAPQVLQTTVRVAATETMGAMADAGGRTSQVSRGVAAPDRLSQILGGDALPGRMVLLGMLIAFALGALHALSPGHGKTVVASFLVGARGTIRHAIFLGAVVTFTHTIGVFLLGIVVLYLSSTIVPDRIYPWIGFVSGLTILGVGVSLFRQRLSRLAHVHGPGGHSHEIPSEITFKNLLALGFSGGIVPCPSALVVLLSAIALHRVAAGLLFIVAFSFGLASVLVAIGILVVRASRLLPGFDSERGITRLIPVASSAIISVIGLVMAVQAVGGTDLTGRGLLFTGQAIAVLLLGLFLGLKHATDADHVVAVTTFVSQESSILRSCWIGAFWGIGHTLSLAVAGLVVIGFKVNFPEWLSDRLELAVAAMLVLLGANVIVKTLRSNAVGAVYDRARSRNSGSRAVIDRAYSTESRLESAHSHWHLHVFGHPHAHSGWTHGGLRPLLTGMVHGAAGSAALMLLVLSTIRSPLEAFLYILIFGFGSILGMLAISVLLAIPLHWARGRMQSGYKPVQLLAGVFSCVFGLFLGAHIWMSLR